ncbi:MAG: HAD family hydrolase [Parachlamydia sp.]|nr:HAD family hydrolase [Parachlamydia sp.]
MKLVVWDFNGVLEMGTEDAVFEITNLALQEMGYAQRFTKQLCDLHYGKKWYLYFQELIPDLPVEKCFELQQFCYEYSASNPHITERCIKAHPEAHHVLGTIASRGHHQILISNSNPEFLMRYLTHLDLHKAFDKIFHNASYPGRKSHDKVDVLQSFLHECGENYDEIVAVDDLPDNLSLKNVPSLKFCLYRHAPPFPDCAADFRTHSLQDVLHCLTPG